MSCTISPSADGKFIVITVTESINRESAMGYNRDAHALGARLGINRYLMDVFAAVNTDTVYDQHRFAYQDLQDAPEIVRSARVAILVNPDDHSHDFIETVCRNAGLDVTIFTRREEAEAHLRRD